jgi:hypothetical protein
MKKVFFLIALMAIMAGCGSNEKPISGTGLYSYKKDGKIGVKGYFGILEEEKIIIPADFISVEAYAGLLFLQTNDSPETYKIYRQDGNPALKPEIKILEKTENYRILTAINGKGDKVVIRASRPGISSVYDEIYISGEFIFGKEQRRDNWELWGVDGPLGSLAANYDQIIVAQGKSKTYYIVHIPKEISIINGWQVKDSDGWLVSVLRDAEFKAIEAKLPKAKETFANGMLAVYEYEYDR